MHGELIDQLGFRVRPGKQAASMGETLTVKRGAAVDVDITQDLYLRLRGKNLAAGMPEETGADGNPLSDFLAVRNLKLDPETAAGRDLWFYSNPVFVKVQ